MSWQSTKTLKAGSSFGNGNLGFDNAWNAYLVTSSGSRRNSSTTNVGYDATRCKSLPWRARMGYYNILVEASVKFSFTRKKIPNNILRNKINCRVGLVNCFL